MSLKLDYAARTKYQCPTLACRPTCMAPYPNISFCRWWPPIKGLPDGGPLDGAPAAKVQPPTSSHPLRSVHWFASSLWSAIL